MENIFAQITGGIPAPSKKDADALAQLTTPSSAPARPTTLEDKVLDWQKTNDKAMASDILKELKPTISSAINSYAQGMEKEVAIPAAKLTLESLKNYKPGMGTSPSTYVFYRLKRLNRNASGRSSIIKYPEKKMAESKAVRDFMARFEDDNGREPSISEIADGTGMSERKVSGLMDTNMILSESSTVADDSFETTLGKKDVTDKDYYYYVYRSVGPVDQKIMEWSSGFNGKPVLSNHEVANRLHISPAAVSQRRNKIYEKLSEARGLV